MRGKRPGWEERERKGLSKEKERESERARERERESEKKGDNKTMVEQEEPNRKCTCSVRRLTASQTQPISSFILSSGEDQDSDEGGSTFIGMDKGRDSGREREREKKTLHHAK